MVLDGVRSLLDSDALLAILKNCSTHIIILDHSSQPPDALRKEIDQQLIRGWNPITIEPLSTVHTTQRIVHSIMSQTHFTPLNREQRLLEKIANLTSGCPGLVSLTNTLLHHCLEEAEKNNDGLDFLDHFASRIPLLTEERTPHPDPILSSASLSEEVAIARSRAGSFRTNSYISELITAFQLPPAHEFVLRALSVFAPLPIPLSVTDIVQRLVTKATQGSIGGAPNSISNLLSTKLLCSYPTPVIRPPNNQSNVPIVYPRLPTKSEKYVYVPQLVQDALWEEMEDTDVVFTITTAFKTLQEYTHRTELSESERCFATGLVEAIVIKCDTDTCRHCIDDSVYKETYKLLVSLQLKVS